MDWILLGIAPTKDKTAITNAYRQKLRQTNPEDKPEEFKALRQAYEEAMALANQEDAEPARDESPVGQWIRSISALYEDYAARIDPACWKPLLSADVCIGLDTRPLAEEALLKFLMEHYYLPKAVWQALDDTFSFRQRAEELYESWPREFIDHAVLAGLRMEPSLNYGLFIPGVNGTDCDTYRRLYQQANQTPLQETGPILEQLDALSERHPYGDALRYQFYIETGREQAGKEGFRQLADAYPNDSLLALAWADICLADGETEAAQDIAAHILELAPSHTGAKILQAKCLAAKKQYHEAKEIAYEVLHDSSDNPLLNEETTGQIRSWNTQLILEREAQKAAHPEDMHNLIELAWCYIQNERLDDALALAQTIDPDSADAFSYHNLMGKLYHNMQRFSEALEHLQIVEEIIRNLQDDGTQETRKRMARLPEMLQIQGLCYWNLERAQEARAKLEEALAAAPQDVEVLSLMGKILFVAGDYAYAVEILRQLLQVSPQAWFAESMLALCFYRMRHDREAFDAINRALSMQNSDLGSYILKMQILLRNEVFDGVHEILDFLKENGVPEDIATDFIRAQLTELEKKDIKNALKQYQALQKRLEAGEDLMLSAELYFRIAVLTGNQTDVSQEHNRAKVLDIVDKGLTFDPQDPDLLAYKAWVLKKGDLYKEAIDMYQKVLHKNPNSLVALQGIADLHYEDLHSSADKALTCYEKLLDTQKTPWIYYRAATCKRYLGDFEGARVYYLKQLEMNSEDLDGYRGLAYIEQLHGNYAKVLELLDQALAIMAEYNHPFDELVEHKAIVLRRMGQYEEALTFAAEAADRYHYSGAFQLQFDICCQFGLWERAQSVLEQWKRANRNDPDLLTATGNLQLLQGKLFKATLAMGAAKHKLSPGQTQDFRLQLAELECNYDRQIEILSQRIKHDRTNNHALLHLAFAYWHKGIVTTATAAAQKSLTQLDNILGLNLIDEPLFRSRRCLALALLGRAEEAMAELEAVRKLPLCLYCPYGSCKDADIYEAQIEEILGNTEKAQKLYAAGRAKWPDDLDFAAGEARLKKKGRK